MDVRSCFMCLSFFFFRRCFPIDFIVIVLMFRSLMPAVIFAFVIAFIKFICFYALFRPSLFFPRCSVLCVYKFVYWKSVFVRLCLFLGVYLLVCQREVVVRQGISEPESAREPDEAAAAAEAAMAGSRGTPCPVSDDDPRDSQSLPR